MTFFGLNIEPKKAYNLEVEEAFRVSMASLLTFNGKTRSTLHVNVDGQDYNLCSLSPSTTTNGHEQHSLDLIFSQGEEVTFSVTGPDSISLTGNYLDDYMEDGQVSDGSDVSEISEISEISEDDDIEDGDDEEIDSDTVDGIDDQVVLEVLNGKRPLSTSTTTSTTGNKKKPKIEEIVEEIVEEKVEKVQQPQRVEKVEKVQQPLKEQKEQKEQKVEKVEKVQQPEKTGENKKTTLPSGLVIEDVKKGDGPRAKNGKRVSVRYIGKLQSTGKVFDSNTKGKPFSFKLGAGEVIKGWELGVQGMQIGGMRRLVVPSDLAYGSAGAAPDIPKNATLIFEIKLMGVK